MPKIGIGGTGNIDNIQMDEQAGTPSTPAAGLSAIYLKSDGLYVIDDAGNVTGPLIDAAVGGNYTEGARVYHSGNQSISDTSATDLNFDSERYDTDGIHDTVTNNERLTCQTAGKYLITGNVEWDPTAGGRRDLIIKLNGSTTIAVVEDSSVADATAYPRQCVSTIYDLSVSDYVTLQAFQTSGGALSVQVAGNYSPEFMMQRIG